MIKHLPLLLFIGLAWGQDLKLANAYGDTVLVKQGERFILNGRQHTLIKVNYQNQTITAKGRLMPWVFAPFSFVNFLYKGKEINFNSIRFIKFMKLPYSILPMSIGGALGSYIYFIKAPSDYDWFNLFLGLNVATPGLVISITEPTFSKKIILDNDEWSIVND